MLAEPPPRKTLKPLMAVTMETLGDRKAKRITLGLMMAFVEATRR